MDPVTAIFPAKLQTLIATTLKDDSKEMEREFDSILDGMEKAGMLTTEARTQVLERLFDDVNTALMLSLVQALTDDDKKNLQELYQSELNEHQQLHTILLLYKQRTGSELEETLIDIYDRALKQFIHEYYILKETAEEASKLSDEECDQVNALIEQGQWKEAVAKFEELSKGASAKPADASQGSPAPAIPVNTASSASPDTEMIIKLLREGKFEEAKRVMDGK